MNHKFFVGVCFVILHSFFGSIQGYGQNATVRGYVYDIETGEPVIYSTVYLDKSTLGTNSDFNGFYNLTNVPPGTYTLVATYIGYDTARVEITLKPGQILNKSMYLKESGVQLGAIDISAQRQSSRVEVQVSQISVTAKQIKALPSVGGDSDIAQYLQVLPGVISTGDQGGQIFIRGGAPVQNKILLDGLNIYNPFHSLGFYSVFETEVIRKADVLSGGFNAEHGGRISAIVDIKTREGDKKNLSGFASVSPFMGKILLEGPLSKFEEGKGSTSFILTGKKSLIDRTSQTLYKYAVDSTANNLPFAFQDLYGKVSLVNSNGSKVNIFGFNFSDDYDNPSVARIGWDNSGVGANFSLVPEGSDILISGTAGVSNYKIGIIESDGNPRESATREFGANFDFTIFGDNNEVKYGFDLRSIKTDFNFTNPFGLTLNEVQNTTELAVFVKYRQVFGNLVIEPSIRGIYYASQSEVSPEPRLGIKYNITNRLRFKGAAGIYTQNILSTDTERDVVNLFFGFLTGPESRVLDFDGTELTSRLQRSRHLVGGFEYDLGDNLQFNLEGYLKDFPQLIVVNRNKLLPTDPNYAKETGKAYGIDLSAKYEQRGLYLWATYSYGFVNRFDGKQEYFTVFDRRHNANLLATLDLDEDGSWQVSARWNFGSGFPFTQTRGFFNDINFGGGVFTDYVTENPDNLGIVYSDVRNGGRLPYYHRLDVSMTKKFEFSKKSGLELVFSITNAYDRENIFYFDRLDYRRVNQLPILPSLGAKFYF